MLTWAWIARHTHLDPAEALPHSAPNPPFRVGGKLWFPVEPLACYIRGWNYSNGAGTALLFWRDFLPRLLFFPCRLCGGRVSRHFTPRAVAILSGTSFFFQHPSPLLRFFEKTLPSWKSDVTHPGPRTVVATMTYTEGLVGNLSTGRKGGCKHNITLLERFSPCQFCYLMCQYGIRTPRQPNRFSIVWIPPQLGDSKPFSHHCWEEPLTEVFYLLFFFLNGPKGRKCFRPQCVCKVRALGGLWVASRQTHNLLGFGWLPYLTQPLFSGRGF